MSAGLAARTRPSLNRQLRNSGRVTCIPPHSGESPNDWTSLDRPLGPILIDVGRQHSRRVPSTELYPSRSEAEQKSANAVSSGGSDRPFRAATCPSWETGCRATGFHVPGSTEWREPGSGDSRRGRTGRSRLRGPNHVPAASTQGCFRLPDARRAGQGRGELRPPESCLGHRRIVGIRVVLAITDGHSALAPSC